MLKRHLIAIFVTSLVLAYMAAMSGVSKYIDHGFIAIIIAILAHGIVIYLHFFAPLIFISAILGLFLCFGWIRSAGAASSGRAVFGLASAAALALMFHGEWMLLPAGALSGAICGWIYWRIAIRGSARRPVT